jgi:hypothetical protein
MTFAEGIQCLILLGLALYLGRIARRLDRRAEAQDARDAQRSLDEVHYCLEQRREAEREGEADEYHRASARRRPWEPEPPCWEDEDDADLWKRG